MRGGRPTGGPSRFLTEAGLLAAAQLARRLTHPRPATAASARAPDATNPRRLMPPHHAGDPPARTHAEATALFRRPFAPGAIGFRAMTKVPLQRRALRAARRSPPTSAPSRSSSA